MPELIEVEMYRRAFDPLIGRLVSAVEAPDVAYIRPNGTPREVLHQLVGERLHSTSRHGKLLILHFGGAPKPGVETLDLSLGMRFGMTGRLLINGSGPIDKLEYASGRDEPAWDRFTMTFGRSRVSMRDQRRLGSVELDPGVEGLGAEASTITASELSAALRGRTKAIKAVLLDQSLVAGLGNLLVDESLWRCGIAPTRRANSFDDAAILALADTVRATVAELSSRGGSHTGDSFVLRAAEARCPHDGERMRHDTVGGRSTWWCQAHQH